MTRLDGKVAIVTGAGRAGNIGLAICEAFLAEGAQAVVATDLRTEDAEQISAELGARHGAGRFRLLEHDVTVESSWQEVLDQTLEEFDGLDVLVNNAGLSIHGGVSETSLEDLRRVMAVNHDAIFLGTKVCANALERAAERFAGGGSIVNNLSMASYMPAANNLGYAVSKAAARMLTLICAEELGPRRIRVNSVHPGLTVTPLLAEGFADYARRGMAEDAESAIDAVAAMAPLGIRSHPEDTAHAFVYFASDESRFVTGSALYHDGGLGRRF